MVKRLVLPLLALAVMVAAPQATAQTPGPEGDLKVPGGIAALPSSVPAVPGLANQLVPAIIGTDQYAIVTAFCGVMTGDPLNAPCADVGGDSPTGSGSITFTLTRVFPSGAPAATIAGSGGTTQVVTDNEGGDLDLGLGVVTVRVDAAAAPLGVNEVLLMTACDELGDCRSATIVVVDSMLPWGPTGAVTPASDGMVFVSYHCDVLGRSPLAGAAANMEAVCEHVGGDGSQGLDDMYDCHYGPNLTWAGPGLGYGSNTVADDVDLLDMWCGGDTGDPLDNSVTFQTDKGTFDLSPVAWDFGQVAALVSPIWFYPPGVDADCSSGKNINIADNDALPAWWTFWNDPLADWEAGCDIDGWQNGVVTTVLLGTGEVGVATVCAQQGGGSVPPREVSVTFVGEAALVLFIECPEIVCATGGEFTVAVVDEGLRPVGDETVECAAEPVGGPLVVTPPSGITGGIMSDHPGEVSFNLAPTGIPGDESTIECRLVSDPSVGASEVVQFDSDCDGVPNGQDNCLFVANPGQENADSGPPPSGTGAIDNGKGIPGGDATVASGDTFGDACDDDLDNDGLLDAYEDPLANCWAFNGITGTHPNPAGGDVTNDDNGDGNPAPPMGSDSADNGPSWDTDNDGVPDGAECALGYNPRDGASKPGEAECGGSGDTDGDGLLDAWETCKWGTDPGVIDSDGDTLGDCEEAADVDGNGIVDFVNDLIYYARAALLWPCPGCFGKTMDFDLNGDGVVDFVADVMQEAKFALIAGLCQ